ncbi:hypothetical protein NAT51_00365 [Flavobacterium amniphilum]|uniref:hypothetical protein n=1 Tax=Flavobacterium amniphilum TaxID=1834035 RepID=UPI00202A5BE8|nr:hypothetical protein [Flavobacterium amniphilum]MCL9803957.1 hypothetical protein [Flavobacterium amniphilum]
MEKKLTDFQIALRGQLLVNLPVIAIIIGSSALLGLLLKDPKGTIIIGVFLGWIYWKVMTPKWIMWAVNKGADTDKIAAIGKRGMLVWSKQYVINVVEGNKKPWF